MFEEYTAIEEFRIRYHPEAYLRLLARDEGKKYQLLTNVEAGFFIGRREATAETKLSEILTIDFRYSPDVDPRIVLGKLIAVDLVESDDSYKRYSIGSNHPPSFSHSIYSQTINASFNDTNEIVGVFVPDPNEPIDSFISREVPAGNVDGSNRTFYSEFDFAASTLEVYLNGLLQEVDVEYTTSGQRTIIFSDPPAIDDEVLISYFIGFGDQVISGETPSGVIDGSNATFLSEFEFIPESVAVYINGVMQKRIQDFNTSGLHTVFLTDSPGIGEDILISYLRS